MILLEDATNELMAGYTEYTDAASIGVEIHRGDSELVGLTGISLTVTISTLIFGCG
jgi:hypothetical protein